MEVNCSCPDFTRKYEYFDKSWNYLQPSSNFTAEVRITEVRRVFTLRAWPRKHVAGCSCLLAVLRRYIIKLQGAGGGGRRRGGVSESRYLTCHKSQIYNTPTPIIGMDKSCPPEFSPRKIILLLHTGLCPDILRILLMGDLARKIIMNKLSTWPITRYM